MENKITDVETLFKNIQIDSGLLLENLVCDFNKEQFDQLYYITSQMIEVLENKDLTIAHIVAILCHLVSAFPIPESKS